MHLHHLDRARGGPFKNTRARDEGRRGAPPFTPDARETGVRADDDDDGDGGERCDGDDDG